MVGFRNFLSNFAAVYNYNDGKKTFEARLYFRIKLGSL